MSPRPNNEPEGVLIEFQYMVPTLLAVSGILEMSWVVVWNIFIFTIFHPYLGKIFQFD